MSEAKRAAIPPVASTPHRITSLVTARFYAFCSRWRRTVAAQIARRGAARHQRARRGRVGEPPRFLVEISAVAAL
jgi:hypothetical protein